MDDDPTKVMQFLGYAGRRPEDFELPRPSLSNRLRKFLAFAAPLGPRIKGLDLAPDYQKNEILDVEAIKAAGYVFAIVQASRGLWAHPNFVEFCKPLVDSGMPILTYHLFLATLSGVDQAQFHLQTVAPLWRLQGFAMPVGNDIELRDGVAVSVRVTRKQDFSHEIGKLVRALEYCSPALQKELMGDVQLSQDVIGWVAHWINAAEPAIPGGWSKAQTLFWQYGVATKYPWCPAVPGMKSDVDVNYFFGTIEDLYKLAGTVVPEPPPGGGDPPPIPDPEEEMTKAEIVARIDAMKTDIAEDVAELDVLREEVLSLPEGGTTPPPAPSPTTRSFRITKDKSLAHWHKDEKHGGFNQKGKPIMIIYENPRYIYGNEKEAPNVNSGQVVTITKDALIAADGSNPGPWYTIANKKGQAGEVLFIDSQDGRIE